MKSIKIRVATSEDIPQIFRLVEELAIYENALNEVSTTVDIYLSDFRENKFRAIVAEHNNSIVGTAIFYPSYSTWKGKMMWLEDFIVKEDCRKIGIGQLLFNEFLKISKSEDCKLVKWEVLHWNAPAIKFYEKNNATIKKGWWDCLVYFD